MRVGKFISGSFQLSFLLFGLVSAYAQSPQLSVTYNTTNGLPYFSAAGTNANAVYKLQVSTNLLNWTDAGTFLQNIAPYADLSAAKHPSRFYRVVQLPKTATNDFENQLKATWPLGKFLISLDQPDLVYFHGLDTFHYQFASQRLPQFASLSSDQFDELALHPAHQQVLLGGIEFLTSDTIGIEFVTAEPFEPTRLVEFFKTVTSRIALPGYQFVYLPSGPERANVLANIDYFQSQGIPIHELSEFRTDSVVQSEGWAVGTLKYIPLSEIDAALAAGAITPDTILVSDGSPRDLPPISGFISLYPSSPNSHTVLRLNAQSLPYLDLPAAQRSVLSNNIGQLVVFSTINPPDQEPWASGYFGNAHYPVSWYSPIHLVDLGTATESFRSELARAKTPKSLNVPTMLRFGSYAQNVDNLNPSDSRFFGSKAANYSLLRHANLSNTQPAIALSFDLWLDFLNQGLPTGNTLRDEITARIALISTNAAGSFVSSKLQEIRDLIEHTAQFTASQKTLITNSLSLFDPAKKIRFRSSSNAEDLPVFSAAGLYESFSGCLLDDAQPGPPDICLCDPADDKRRSVFRAIQKVFASFYNDQAFLERRRFQMDEASVGMALLVHHSFPDEIELANGIADIDFQIPLQNGRINFASIVSQRGAVSVANPSGPDLPETFQGYPDPFGGSFQGSIIAFTTIRPPGVPVLNFPDDYNELLFRFQTVARTFPWTNFLDVRRLNFEFKKTPLGLSIKQVRPAYTSSGSRPPILLPGKTRFVTFQEIGLPGSIQKNHDLKSIWDVESSGWLPGTDAIFTKCRVAYLSGNQIRTNNFAFVSGSFTATNTAFDSTHRFFTGIGTINSAASNIYHSEAGDASFVLNFILPAKLPDQNPLLLPSDLILSLAKPGASDSVSMAAEIPESLPDSSQNFRTIQLNTNSVSVEIDFWRNVHPNSAWLGVGPTYNLLKWEQTVIAGLTATPIVLKGFFSQTYSAGRHNFVEYFLFEPGLEEGISSQQLAELNAANVKQIYVEKWNTGAAASGKIDLVGFDGEHRPVPASP